MRRILVAIAAIGVIGGGLVVSATSAQAVASGSIVVNGDGTWTVTYDGVTGPLGLFICPTSVSAAVCSPGLASYLLHSTVGTHALSASPATVSSGMAISNGAYPYSSTTLAAGTYNVRLVSYGTAITTLDTATNAVLSSGGGGGGSSSSSSTPVLMWQQAYGRASATDTCQSGYTPSWDTWPNGGKGGFVCNRFVPEYGN